MTEMHRRILARAAAQLFHSLMSVYRGLALYLAPHSSQPQLQSWHQVQQYGTPNCGRVGSVIATKSREDEVGVELGFCPLGPLCTEPRSSKMRVTWALAVLRRGFLICENGFAPLARHREIPPHPSLEPTGGTWLR